ncbi:hypothetical protein E3O42_03140 [Cryobacterium adonitolivorans]|uniref:Sortase n=1 Tax=Cryobacterium adonitolivorans TaxID=1259189 RepID=A0A4R8WD95_9MICO|nr:hypothetical protein [Cryobacterium adonitolivorans]TFC05562.1 hypothetical protein E3O42_03140 [Cryobacterium adonitolivorans]
MATALAALAVFAVPAAANAAGYVPDDNISVAGDITPDATVTVSFIDGSFTPEEEVSFTLSGETAVDATLATLKSVVNSPSMVKTGTDTGAVALDVTLPKDASGTYTITATGLTSGTTGTSSLTVSDADATEGAGAASGAPIGGGLASSGYNGPMLVIWGAAGTLLLGVAMVVVLGVVRRQRATV